MQSNIIKSRFFLLIASILVLVSCPAYASNVSENIKSYINNIKSIAVDFVQIDSNGNKSNGTLIINKPYKFRCNYYKPFPLLIIGNKNYVSVYDFEMEHLSRITAAENIFNFLLVDKINFENQFKILSEKEIGNSYSIKLYYQDLNRTSQINFNKTTKQIESLTIFEENNTITITFAKTHKIKDINNNLFIVQDPDVFGKPERLDKAKLEKNYQLES